jgi:PhoPQ-activated pathogenicity-related protein
MRCNSGWIAAPGRWLIGLLALVLCVALPPGQGMAEVYDDPATALRDYVAAPDPNYHYRLIASDPSGDGYAAHLIRMVSQEWRPDGSARPALWRHWLVVIVPDEVDEPVAALVVAGGSRDSDPPSLDDQEVRFGAQLAVLSNTPVAVLTQVPEQPQFFPDEPFAHEEDALVAYSWNKALETGDYSWPVYVPMVKAVVRAMDTVQDFVPAVADERVEEFVVIGASKRGAATWLTGAVDPRVSAIAPMVIDIPNFSAQMAHHLAVYGTYAPAIQDYVDYDLVQRVDTPEGARLRQVIDPISYVRDLDMPKYILNSTGDQFFPPDAARFYLSDLEGESLLRYVPNSDHSLSNTDASLIDAVSGLFGWYLAVVEDLPRPTITWRYLNARLVVRTSPAPLAARLWRTRNSNARDFRLGTIGEAWTSRTLAAAEPGVYRADIRTPDEGWKAFFVELVYPSPRPGLCQVYSTRVFVAPDQRPFEGTVPATAPVAAGDVTTASLLEEAGDFFDSIFESVADDVHGSVLEEALEEGDLDDRAIRLCAAQDLDEFDDALELYARLGTGQSFDTFLEDRLEEVWDDARETGENIWYDVRDGADDVIDDTIDFVGDGADDVVDFVGDLF